MDTDDGKREKAKLFYLKGRLVDVLPPYEKAAEELLTKAVRSPPRRRSSTPPTVTVGTA
jgi:hypothetical protein